MEVRHPVLFEHQGVGQITSERLQANVRFLEFYFVPHPAIRYRASATMLRGWSSRCPNLLSVSARREPSTLRAAGAGVGRDRPRRRRTPSRSSRLELAAAASPASTGGRAPGRALGAPRFQEAYFVAVASDSCWQFGLACQTSWCDGHPVRLSKLLNVAGVSAGVAPCRQTVAPLATRGQVSSLRAVKLPAGRAPTPRSRRGSSSRTRIFSSAGLMVS